MMSILRGVGLLVVLAAAAAAQHRGGGASAPAHSTMASPRNTYGSIGGFGNVVYPGTGHAPGTQASPRNTYGSIGGFGNVVYPGTGHAPGTHVGSPAGGFQSGRFRRPVVYPVIVGGYYGYGYPFGGYYDGGYNGYPYQGDPGAYASQQPAPQVIINQNFIPDRATPVVREYAPDTGEETIRTYNAPGRAPVESSEDSSAYYLLAFKDSSVYSAFAYWVEGDTLHYVTSDRIHNQASLNLVDRELTERLNRDRNMQVRLPR